MVVKFAIEPDAMVESSGDTSQAMKAQHKRLIALWERFGTLVDPGKGRNSIISNFEGDALRPVRTLWREAWKARSRCRRVKPSSKSGIEWANINQASDLAAHKGDIELALARIHRWTGMDGVRTSEGGEGVTGAMIRARIWVDGR